MIDLLTKIVATVGPACSSPTTLARLIEEGARVFRLNFSHGTFDDFERSLAAIREAAEITGLHVGVLGDLSGPKLRLGKVREEGIELNAGDHVEFQVPAIVAGAAERNGEPVVFSTNHPALIGEVNVGERLLIDDGAVRLLVVDKTGGGEGQRLVANVTHGGRVSSGKGVNLPDNASLSVPSLTYDRRCVTWAIEHELDYLALSFVRRAEDLRELKGLLPVRTPNRASWLPVIAKIEKPQALAELGAIIDEADGVMVARGDLGVEMDLAEVPGIQKRIVRMAHDYGKPVIVATQMLQSMITSPTPTRAEASDVANAIYEGADAVMLSGETAVGKYPVQAVHTMARIARVTQRLMCDEGLQHRPPPIKLQESRYRTAALAHAVSVAVRDLDAKLVVTWSELGGGARYLSQNHLGVPILAFGSNRESLRKMALLYGVTAIWMERPEGSTAFVHAVDTLIQEREWAKKGDPIVIVKGEPIGMPGVTNELLIHFLGDVTNVRWHLKSPPGTPGSE
jgi:pyruvate kinase